MLQFNLTFELFILEDIMWHIITQMSGWHHPAPTTTIPTYICSKAGGVKEKKKTTQDNGNL